MRGSPSRSLPLSGLGRRTDAATQHEFARHAAEGLLAQSYYQKSQDSRLRRRLYRTSVRVDPQSLATAIQRRSLVRILQDKSAEAAMLTQEILRIRNEERKRIARDLHDDIIQPMIATSYSVAMFEDANAPQVRQRLLDLIELTRNICFELRQPALDTLGFGAAARTAVHDFRSRSHLDATIAIDEAPGIVVPEHVAAAALGILGEALQNADKHAEATSVTVNVVVHPDHLKVRVKDDGRGFDPTEAQARAARTKHFGLQTMSERVAGAGGQYNVTSAPGQGACVEAIFPLTPPAGD